MHSSASRACVALIAIAGLAACTGESLPVEPDLSESATAAAPTAAPAMDVAGLVGNSWAARAAMPTARAGLVAATVNGIVYAIGGYDVAGAPLAKVEAHNSSAATVPWNAKAPMPARRAFPNGAGVINGKIYVAGGFNAEGSVTRSLFVYNPATNTWATKAPMPVASAAGTAAVIGGKLYVIGLPASADPSRSRLFRYDPGTNTWTERRRPPDNLTGATVGVINGKLFLAGGITPEDAAMNKLSVYDPATNAWATRAPLPAPRVFASGGVIDGRLYVTGGSAGGFSAATLVYDPQSNSWAAKTNAPTARHSAAAAVADGLLYVLGGATQPSAAISTNEMYIP